MVQYEVGANRKLDQLWFAAISACGKEVQQLIPHAQRIGTQSMRASTTDRQTVIGNQRVTLDSHRLTSALRDALLSIGGWHFIHFAFAPTRC
jgi:hypothetical protein